MNLVYYFAKRYLFAKKSTQVINIISLISVLGVCIGSAALLVILSVFNGFEELNLIYYKKLNPDLKITQSQEHDFPQHSLDSILLPLQQDATVVKSMEQYVLLRYGQNTSYAKLKGYDQQFLAVKALDSTLVAGEFIFQDSIADYLIMGYGLTQQLGIRLEQTVQQVSVFASKGKLSYNALDPLQGLNRGDFFPSGVFSVQQDMDNEQVFCGLPVAQKLFAKDSTINAVEIFLADEKMIDHWQHYLEKNLGKDFQVKNRYQLNEMLYKVLNSERWAVYLVMSFILAVAITNIVGAITMLIIEKKRDIEILSSMGLSAQSIRRIFLLQSLMISALGVLIGLGLGTAFVMLQEQYGIIKIAGSEGFMIQSYPIQFIWTDLLLVLSTVMVITLVTGWFSSRQAMSLVKS